MLLFRFVGSFLLRFEARTFLVLLFQEPPRIAAALRSYQDKPSEQLAPQLPGVAESGVAEPCRDSSPYVREVQFRAMEPFADRAQPPAHAHHIPARQPGTPREKPPAEKRHAIGAAVHAALALCNSRRSRSSRATTARRIRARSALSSPKIAKSSTYRR